MTDRIVLVVSGSVCSGKSYLLKQLLQCPILSGATTFRIDPIRQTLYGQRDEMLRALVLGAPAVVVEAVMLTRREHQEPMVEMAARAEKYLQAIERECALRDGISPADNPVKVKLKVLLCYASLECMTRRIEGEHADRRQSGTLIFDWRGMEGGYRQFEFPEIYEPLYLDTSDESDEGNQGRLVEVEKFLKDELDLSAINPTRRQAAEDYHRSIYRKIMGVGDVKV